MNKYLQSIQTIKNNWHHLTQQEKQEYINKITTTQNQTNPTQWAKTNNLNLTKYQKKILQTIANTTKPINRITIRAPRGAGKTYTAATALLWFIATAEQTATNWAVLTTAPVHSQLKDVLWPEFHRLATQTQAIDTNPNKLLEMRYKGDHGLATARTVTKQRAGTIEGIHADKVMIIIDEAKEVPNTIFDSIEGSLSQAGTENRTAIVIAISTPGAKTGYFYDMHTKKSRFKHWEPIHIKLKDTIEAGRVSKSWADDMKNSWGETSWQYRNHVLGEFASDDTLAFIFTSWIERSNNRWNELMENHRQEIESGSFRLGVDPAYEGSDETVVCFYNPQHNIVTKFWSEPKTENIVTLGEKIASTYSQHDLNIDSVGLGAGVYDAARKTLRQGLVNSFKSNAKTNWSEPGGTQAANLRTAAYLKIKSLLNPEQDKPLALPPDYPSLIADLQAPRMIQRAGSKIGLSSKDDIKKLLGRSPDYGDALAMACWSFDTISQQGLAKEYSLNIPPSW